MKKNYLLASFLPLLVVAGLTISPPREHKANHQTPQTPNAGLKLPAGFSAEIIAATGALPRHIAVAPNGLIYLKSNITKRKPGNAILVYKTGADGKAVRVSGFGNYTGTGIYIKSGYLYASSNTEVFRYKLNAAYEVIDTGKAEKVITGLKMGNEHETKSLVLDNAGNIYVNIGAYSNSCQQVDRAPGSMGIPGCPILDSAGGIWMFKADKLNQTYKDGVRYTTGLRNVMGLDWNTQLNQLFVMQHGRDQLNSIFPKLYTVKESSLLPAECMYALKKGDNAGWPFMYYDEFQHKKIKAPEYGGDGKIEADKSFIDPVAAYPGHLAPNGLLFYTGNQFPEKYKNGAFIAFHGSWNRAPEPQAGAFVVFQPFKDGKPSGEWEIFADNFAGTPEKEAAGRPDHKPCGLAQGPDGSLYVTDDLNGNVYRISYKK